MGISKKLKEHFQALDQKESKKLIKMAWEDRVSYQDIEKAYHLTPGEVEKFMRYKLDEKDFIRWRKRQNKRFTLKSKKAQQRIL